MVGKCLAKCRADLTGPLNTGSLGKCQEDSDGLNSCEVALV